MIDRNALKEAILVNIPFWFGYMAGKSDKFIHMIVFGVIATLVVIIIKRGEQ